MRRKFFQLSRTPLSIFFELIIPTIQIFLFITCIGSNPSDLKIGVVNRDVGSTFQNRPINLGNDIVNFMKDGSELDVISIDNFDDALEQVKLGNCK